LTGYHFIELPKYKDDKNYENLNNRWLYTLINGEKFINDPAMLPDAIKEEDTIMKAIKKKYLSDKEVINRIIDYRTKSLTDIQIYDELKDECKKDTLVIGITVIATKDKMLKNNKKFKMLVVLIALFTLLNIVIISFGLANGVKYQFIALDLFFGILLIWVSTKKKLLIRSTYRGIIYLLSWYIIFFIFSVGGIKVSLYISLSLLNSLIAIGIIFLAISLKDRLFPYFPPETDENGEYVFKQ
jgi:hypothetical protein